jgi:DNA-binding MarR family transcriptional regulator
MVRKRARKLKAGEAKDGLTTEPRGTSYSKLTDAAAFWLHRLSRSVLARFDERLSALGVTVAQFKVMLVIHTSGGTTPNNLSEYIDVDKGSITRIIDRLVAKGQVTRRASRGDRRFVTLKLAKDGADLIETLIKIADEEDNAWLEALSDDELMLFKKLMGKLLKTQGITYPPDWEARKHLRHARSTRGPSSVPGRTSRTGAQPRKNTSEITGQNFISDE